MKHHYQLTYNVSPHDNKESSAIKARRYIAKMTSTDKVENIETTLVGEVEISNSLNKSEKREEAKDFIDDKIRKILDEHEIFLDVDVYLSLMVDGLGKHIEFNV